MIIDGKLLSKEIKEDLRRERQAIKKHIRLAVVLVGDNPSSLSFIRQKQKVAKEIGIDFRVYHYPETINTKDLRHKVGMICHATYNRGIVVQLPLPGHINKQVVLNAVLENKDPDVLSEKNLGSFYVNRLNILPPVVGAISEILNRHNIEVSGKNVLVIGQGALVGKPAAVWFMNCGATVSVANSQTQDLESLISSADIIVSGVGKANLIKGDMIKSEAVIFDAAVVDEGGKLVGDCDFESCKEKASLITPVPGGIGPMTVVMLYKNLLTLVKEH